MNTGDLISNYNKLKPLLEDENVKRYGSMLVKVGKTGAKKIIGHIESTKKATNASTAIISGTGSISQSTQLLAGNSTSLLQNIGGISNQLGGLASLGWANLAVSGINLGVTAVGMVVIAKKINKLSAEVHEMNGKLDIIIEEMHKIYAGVRSLQDNEIRKLYEDTYRQINQMNGLMFDLKDDGKEGYLRQSVKTCLRDANSHLSSLISRYNDDSCNIALGFDAIMAYFYTYASLIKMYISSEYLHNGGKVYNYIEFESSIKMLCSQSMINSVLQIYKNASTSFMSPQEIGQITSLFKNIMNEQVSEIKSQNKILTLSDYNTYKKINDKLQNTDMDSELVLISNM